MSRKREASNKTMQTNSIKAAEESDSRKVSAETLVSDSKSKKRDDANDWRARIWNKDFDMEYYFW